MTRARARGWSRALTVALAAASVSACGSAGGPVRTLSSAGQPDLGMTLVYVAPGQSADAEAYVVNSTHDVVQVTSVSAVAVPGEPEGRLVHTGIQSTGAGVAGMRGWPAVPVRAMVGASLPGGQDGIVFGITGAAPGHDYAVAGLRIQYTYRGQSYSVIAWAGLAACVTVKMRSSGTSCQSFANKVNNIVMKMAGVS